MILLQLLNKEMGDLIVITDKEAEQLKDKKNWSYMIKDKQVIYNDNIYLD